MTELEKVYDSADRNYRESLRMLGDSILLVQDFVDLYQRAADIVAASPLAMKDEHIMAAKFLMAARYYLVTGITDCLRCHLKDTFAETRMAIENVAFAARVKRHPHLAIVWLDAGESKEEYEDYRQKFTKLFPDEHQLLKILGERYDMCAKQTHPSIYAFAGRSKVVEAEKMYTLKFEYFQAERDGSEPIRTFLFILNTHMRIFNVFREVLADALGDDARVLELHANSVDAKYVTHCAQWVQRIPALRPVAR